MRMTFRSRSIRSQVNDAISSMRQPVPAMRVATVRCQGWRSASTIFQNCSWLGVTFGRVPRTLSLGMGSRRWSSMYPRSCAQAYARRTIFSSSKTHTGAAPSPSRVSRCPSSTDMLSRESTISPMTRAAWPAQRLLSFFVVAVMSCRSIIAPAQCSSRSRTVLISVIDRPWRRLAGRDTGGDDLGDGARGADERVPAGPDRARRGVVVDLGAEVPLVLGAGLRSLGSPGRALRPRRTAWGAGVRFVGGTSLPALRAMFGCSTVAGGRNQRLQRRWGAFGGRKAGAYRWTRLGRGGAVPRAGPACGLVGPAGRAPFTARSRSRTSPQMTTSRPARSRTKPFARSQSAASLSLRFSSSAARPSEKIAAAPSARRS
jgi:hypothetical protein